MIDPSTIAILQKQIRRTGRSLLQYSCESFPYAGNSKDEEIVNLFHSMMAEENEAAGLLSAFLLKNYSGPPHLGAYPMFFTTLNYLALERLIPLIIEDHEKDIQSLKEDIAKVQDLQARNLLQQLLESKEKHVATLRELQAPEAVTG